MRMLRRLLRLGVESFVNANMSVTSYSCVLHTKASNENAAAHVTDHVFAFNMTYIDYDF